MFTYVQTSRALQCSSQQFYSLNTFVLLSLFCRAHFLIIIVDHETYLLSVPAGKISHALLHMLQFAAETFHLIQCQIKLKHLESQNEFKVFEKLYGGCFYHVSVLNNKQEYLLTTTYFPQKYAEPSSWLVKYNNMILLCCLVVIIKVQVIYVHQQAGISVLWFCSHYYKFTRFTFSCRTLLFLAKCNTNESKESICCEQINLYLILQSGMSVWLYENSKFKDKFFLDFLLCESVVFFVDNRSIYADRCGHRNRVAITDSVKPSYCKQLWMPHIMVNNCHGSF